MLTELDIDKAAQSAAEGRDNWFIMSVHRAGPQVWTIDYDTPSGVVSVEILCEPGTSQDDARQRIQIKLPEG